MFSNVHLGIIATIPPHYYITTI